VQVTKAAALLPKNVDVIRREVKIRNGKEEKSKIAYFSKFVSDILEHYILYI